MTLAEVVNQQSGLEAFSNERLAGRSAGWRYRYWWALVIADSIAITLALVVTYVAWFGHDISLEVRPGGASDAVVALLIGATAGATPSP